MNRSQDTNPVYDCDTLLELIPEYAFGLTEPEQTRMIEGGLQRCPEAAARLEEFRLIQSEMRADVPQVEPPPELGARLMVAISIPVETATVPAPAAAFAPVTAPAAATTTTRRRVVRFAWVAAVAAIIALVITNLYWFMRVNDLTERQNDLIAAMSGQENAFVLTSTDSLHWVRLANPEAQNDASAFMMWDGDSETGLLYARNFPALEPGHIYHLWLRRSGEERVFAGVFSVDENGDGALLFSSPEPIVDFNWAGITSESPDESPANPPAPVVGGQLRPA